MGGFFVKKFSVCFFIFLAVVFGACLISDFETSKVAVLNGLIICSKIIIPSLFPFTVCLIFIINTNILADSKMMTIIGKLFFLNAQEMSVFLLSLFSGYPTGAKLLNELYIGGAIEQRKAKSLINCCVNAGPAFIISAIGQGIFHSKTLGLTLFISHVFASVFILFLSRKNFKKLHISNMIAKPSLSLTDNFVLSTTSAATSIMNICFYVVLFSVITAYFEKISNVLPIAKSVSFFLEVTNGVTMTRNIYLISFLLGFAGISIWFQVFSCAKDIKPKTTDFALFRVIHGTVSFLLTLSIIKLFNIKIGVFSNTENLSLNFVHSNYGLAMALVLLSLFFIFCVENKKRSGNLVEDLL